MSKEAVETYNGFTKPTRDEICGARSRDEQLEILERYLSFFWEKQNQNMPDSGFRHTRAHARMCWAENRTAKFVRAEDNSVRGFPRRFRHFNGEGHRQQYQQGILDEYFFLLPPPLPPQFIG